MEEEISHKGSERTKSRLPVELDIGDAAVLVDEGVGVHAKALHVAVVQRHAHIILQECELQPHMYIRASLAW